MPIYSIFWTDLSYLFDKSGLFFNLKSKFCLILIVFSVGIDRYFRLKWWTILEFNAQILSVINWFLLLIDFLARIGTFYNLKWSRFQINIHISDIYRICRYTPNLAIISADWTILWSKLVNFYKICLILVDFLTEIGIFY